MSAEYRPCPSDEASRRTKAAPGARTSHSERPSGTARTFGAVCALLLLGASGCGDGAEPGAAGDGGARRSIVLISMDTTRADHIHSYGYPLSVTPHIDALARAGVRYENAYAPMPQTLPSHVSLFTGLWPRQHGALENVYTVSPELTTLAEICAGLGYRTGASIGALALHSLSGVDQGFETWIQPEGNWIEDINRPARFTADVVTDQALTWADTLDGEEPFLLFAHYYDPHGPFEAPRRHVNEVPLSAVRDIVREKHGRGAFVEVEGEIPLNALAQFWQGYAAEIRFTDEEIGRLLAGLEERGLMDDTVVVLVGDHGEGLFEHGVKAHGLETWEPLHRVPFILVDPDGAFAGATVAERVTLMDVLPTVLHMALGRTGATDDADRGRDLWRLLRDDEPAPSIPIYLERPHYSPDRIRDGRPWGEHVAVLDGRHKLLREADGRVLLFDIEADPGERNDLSQVEPVVRARLEKTLAAWMSTWSVPPPGTQMDETDPERIAALQQLGYLGEADADPVRATGDAAGEDEAWTGWGDDLGGGMLDDEGASAADEDPPAPPNPGTDASAGRPPEGG